MPWSRQKEGPWQVALAAPCACWPLTGGRSGGGGGRRGPGRPGGWASGPQGLALLLSGRPRIWLRRPARRRPAAGSGNPAEGELRPQLLDRFGTSVNVSTLQVRPETAWALDRERGGAFEVAGWLAGWAGRWAAIPMRMYCMCTNSPAASFWLLTTLPALANMAARAGGMAGVLAGVRLVV